MNEQQAQAFTQNDIIEDVDTYQRWVIISVSDAKDFVMRSLRQDSRIGSKVQTLPITDEAEHRAMRAAYRKVGTWSEGGPSFTA